MWNLPRGYRSTHAKFHVYRGRNVGIQPPKLSKFWIVAINLCLRGDSSAVFLRNSQHLYVRVYVAFKFLIWSLWWDKQPSYEHFPTVGVFCLKFSIAPSGDGETTDRIKKVTGVKTRQTSSITMQSMVGIVGRAPSVDEKVWCFFCSFFCHALELRSLS